jgi:hypothetical protein
MSIEYEDRTQPPSEDVYAIAAGYFLALAHAFCERKNLAVLEGAIRAVLDKVPKDASLRMAGEAKIAANAIFDMLKAIHAGQSKED